MLCFQLQIAQIKTQLSSIKNENNNSNFKNQKIKIRRKTKNNKKTKYELIKDLENLGYRVKIPIGYKIKECWDYNNFSFRKSSFCRL